MNAMMKTVAATTLGALAGVLATFWWNSAAPAPAVEDMAAEPLYWVAPMDPNYRRDAPGKSPMGMDLIPVYADKADAAATGTVRITPAVTNNLGVRTAEVVMGRLPSLISTVGYVQYDEDQLQHVHPRVEGWIETLFVNASGDPVSRGEPLYTLYSPTLVNAQEELLLAWRRDDPALVKAASERLEALRVPPEAIRTLRDSRTVSRTVTVMAPQDGVVDTLQVRQGMYVKPGMETLSIASLDHLWVIGEVFERQATQVQVGDTVRIQLDFAPGREWEGRIDYVYPTLNTGTRTLQVRVRVANPDHVLRPGMFAQLQVATTPGEQRLLVPREALIRTGSQSRLVLALGEGRFKSVAVETGRVGREQAEILAGIAAGDRIVTSAQFLIDSESSKTSDFHRMEHSRAAREQADDHSGHAREHTR
tara:strand:+ start:23631 stop:24893 length:1263 start_codon:yes stop_codon:yes gene_type:complete